MVWIIVNKCITSCDTIDHGVTYHSRLSINSKTSLAINNKVHLRYSGLIVLVQRGMDGATPRALFF
jgi:hypothetical protein